MVHIHFMGASGSGTTSLAHAHADAFGHVEAAFQQQQVDARQEGAVGDVETAVPLDRETPFQRPAENGRQ
ncbi:hypothetical protein ACC705_34545, partial [Rhizobium ruizarguesonis]